METRSCGTDTVSTYLCSCCFPEAESFFDFDMSFKNLNFFFSPSVLCTSFSAGSARLASLLENKLFRDFLGELFAMFAG